MPGSGACELLVGVVGQDEAQAVIATRAVLNGWDTAVVEVSGKQQLDPEHLALLSDHLIPTRRLRADHLAADLVAPGPDSIVRLLPVGERARLIADLADGLRQAGAGDVSDAHLVDPVALRDGELQLLPIRGLADLIQPLPDSDMFTKPGLAWVLFPWALPDDQSYRDYLRSVFVLFAHQQKLGVGANPTTFPAIVERQLRHRFTQDFRTADRNEAPLNRLLLPIVQSILTAGTGSDFGFGLTAAALSRRAPSRIGSTSMRCWRSLRSRSRSSPTGTAFPSPRRTTRPLLR